MVDLVVVGAGGNIGSQLVPLMVDMPGLHKVTLIDPDRYEASNLASQAIEPADVGRAKCEVQWERLLAMRLELEVVALAERVESVPMGVLRAGVILACLDSRVSRQYVNEVAWRLGIPWIDAGVLVDGLFARVTTYSPRDGAPCIECGWSQADYADLEQQYVCSMASGERAAAIPTNGIRALGALAASLQALRCRALLEGEPVSAEELVVSGSGWLMQRSTLRRNAGCRFDHARWEIERLPLALGETTVRDLVATCAGMLDADPMAIGIGCVGDSFVWGWACANGCTAPPLPLMVRKRIPAPYPSCALCGSRLFVARECVSEVIRLDDVGVDAGRTLSAVGFRDGDVVSVDAAGHGVRRFEVG